MLRQHKLGEADVILTLLTRENGQVRAVAKGLRRTSSKFGARLSPFNCVDLQLYQGQNLDTVQQVVSMGLYAKSIAADYDRFLCGQVILETAQKLTAEESTLAHYRLLHGAVAALADSARPPALVLASYLLRSLALSGWAPQLDGCAICDEDLTQDEEYLGFSTTAGGVVCHTCSPGARPITAAIWQVLRALSIGNWTQVQQASAAEWNQATEIASHYTQWQLEHRLKSLAILERGV